MNRNRFLVFAVLLCAVALVPTLASAQSASTNLAVSASVAANCTISTTPVAFGAYDPVVTNASASRDAAGGVTIACTKGAVPTIGLGLGSNSLAPTTRRMLGVSGDFLTYELYQPAGYTTVWGTSGANLFSAGASTGRAGRTFAVNGRIPGGQDVATGAYTDTVVATVNF
jgi:spore coat protein U-like protein